MSRLELDSAMGPEEVRAETRAFLGELRGGSSSGELHLNCIDASLPLAAALAAFLREVAAVSPGAWKHLEIEECDGDALGALLPVLWNGPFRKIKFTPPVAGDPALFVEPAMPSLAVALRSNPHLRELVLNGVVLGGSSAEWLSEGLRGSSNHDDDDDEAKGLRRLALWDCTLDEAAAATLAEGISRAAGLRDFGLVFCDQCEEQLDAMLHAFYDHECETSTPKGLEQLDLRCLSSGIGPVVRLLEHNSSLRTLDLSFQSGGGDGLDVGLLCRGLRQPRSKLHTLHVCRNYISDDGLDLLLDAVGESPSLRVLNLSLNKITRVHRLAERLAANTLPGLQRILLDGNPIEDPSPLVEALRTNIGLEECLVPQEFEETQQQLHFYTRLNRGGRRLVLVGDPRYRAPRIPMGLWPRVLERANRIDFDNCPNSTGRAEVLYCLLHGPVLFPV